MRLDQKSTATQPTRGISGMRVTLMTDASHCTQTGAGGFGFWCVSDRGKLAGGKPLSGVVKDAYQAEAKGVANSLVMGFRSGIIQGGDTVLVQLDNLAFVRGLSGISRKIRKDIKVILEFISNFCTENNISIECRHVKGHSDKTDSRYASNKHCDRIAKEQMRIARKELKKVA